MASRRAVINRRSWSLCTAIASGFALFLIGMPGHAQIAGVFEGKVIRSIEVQSTLRLTPEAIGRITGVRPGQPYVASALREGMDHLYQTGLFRDVLVEAFELDGGVHLVFTTVEIRVLARLTIQGAWAFREPALRDAVPLSPGDDFSEERLDEAVSNLIAFYENNGYFRTVIRPEVIEYPSATRVDSVLHVSRDRHADRARIRRIRLEGNILLPAWRIFPMLLSGRGEYYSREQIDRDIEGLREFYRKEGYLHAKIAGPAVEYNAEENVVDVTLSVEPGTQLRLNWIFEGARPDQAPTQEELADQLLFQEGDRYDPDLFEASADRLRQFYLDRGFPRTKIRYERNPLPEEKALTATFLIEEGPLACLERVRFEGNRHFTDHDMAEMMTVSPGLMSCRIVNEETLKTETKALEANYRKVGFLDAKIDPELSYHDESGDGRLIRATILVRVTEGIQTQVGSIRFSGNSVFSGEDLLDFTKLRSEDPFDPAVHRSDLDQIRSAHTKKGYIYARVTPRLEFSEDRRSVLVVHEINEDDQVFVGDIVIKGNTYTATKVIHRELLVAPGDLYDESKIQMSRLRVLRLGYLGDVRFSPVTPLNTGAKEYVRDLVLTVSERPAKAIEFGVGYGDVDGPRGFVELSDRNLLGSGRAAALRAQGSRIEQRYSVTYREPWLLRQPMTGSLQGFYQERVRRSESGLTYDLTSYGGAASVEKDLTNHIKTTLSYQYERITFTDIDPAVVFADEGVTKLVLGSINPSMFYDTRDDVFNPHSGTLSSISFRLAAESLASEAQFRKVNLQSSWYFPIRSWFVLALSARGAVVEKFGQTIEVPPSEQFLLGGRSSVRGYSQEQLGIVGETIDPETGKAIGGNATLLFNLEARFYFPFGLGLVLFNDRGNVWLSHEDVNVSELKQSVGAGLRWVTPVGPLRLDFGYKLDREKDLCPLGNVTDCTSPEKESPWEIHFTLGHPF